MRFKTRIDDPFIRLLLLDQSVAVVVGPVQRQARGVGDEEVVKGDGRVYLDQLLAHAWPGEVIDPCRVGREELAGARSHPFGEVVVVFLGGDDHPAHDGEHDVSVSDLA